jgi:prepilin-type N-terminal cleavage/methylation domain-containing protein
MQKGFTLIELMIVLVFIFIGAVIFANLFGSMSNQSTISFGATGIVETRCVDGVKVLIGPRGWVQQIVDQEGKAIKC